MINQQSHELVNIVDDLAAKEPDTSPRNWRPKTELKEKRRISSGGHKHDFKHSTGPFLNILTVLKQRLKDDRRLDKTYWRDNWQSDCHCSPDVGCSFFLFASKKRSKSPSWNPFPIGQVLQHLI